MDLSRIIIIDEKEGKPFAFLANYATTLTYDISELNIDFSKVEHVWCKHGVLRLEMEDETVIEIEPAESCGSETDFKWPIQLQLVDTDYNQLWEE
tara:strand:+ start:320 stop:604 length:285 start_codon:yes stop_codon:yes gene_type:complete